MSNYKLTTHEKDIVKTLLWFANLSNKDSMLDVQPRYMKFAEDTFQVIPKGKESVFHEDRAAVRAALGSITKGKSRNILSEKLTKYIRDKVHPKLDFKNGELQLFYSIDGVEAGIALGVALILDKRKGLTSRLKQCGNPKCLRFNLSFSTNGRPKRHCNKKCRKAADAADSKDRQQRHRDKHKS